MIFYYITTLAYPYVNSFPFLLLFLLLSHTSIRGNHVVDAAAIMNLRIGHVGMGKR